MATHKSLQVTTWTRLRDLIKGLLLYGSFNWHRASDGLKPPRLSPLERKTAMPAKIPEVIKPRENPQAALSKAAPKKAAPIKDITAGAIVSDPLLPSDPPAAFSRAFSVDSPSGYEAAPSPVVEAAADAEETVIVRRRRRHRRHGLSARLAPRTLGPFSEARKPGLLARLFRAK